MRALHGYCRTPGGPSTRWRARGSTRSSTARRGTTGSSGPRRSATRPLGVGSTLTPPWIGPCFISDSTHSKHTGRRRKDSLRRPRAPKVGLPFAESRGEAEVEHLQDRQASSERGSAAVVRQLVGSLAGAVRHLTHCVSRGRAFWCVGALVRWCVGGENGSAQRRAGHCNSGPPSVTSAQDTHP